MTGASPLISSAGRAAGRVAACMAVLGLLLGAGGQALAGTIVRAACPCGYDSGSMFLFGGRANFKTYCAFPVYCQECPGLEVVNLYAGEPACPGCREARALPYDDPSLVGVPGGNVIASWNTVKRLGRALNLTDGAYLCPKCGKFSLRFAPVGLWD